MALVPGPKMGKLEKKGVEVGTFAVKPWQGRLHSCILVFAGVCFWDSPLITKKC